MEAERLHLVLRGLIDHERELTKLALEKLRQEIARDYQGPKERRAELENAALPQALEYLADRIDRQVTIEIIVPALPQAPDGEEPKASESAKAQFAAIQDATRAVAGLVREGEPILLLGPGDLPPSDGSEPPGDKPTTERPGKKTK